MYLRTTQRKNQDGSVVQYYQLAHNIWDPDTRQAKASVIHNFGRADQLNRDELVRLCHSIARVCGLLIHDPLAEEQESHPETLARLPDDIKLIATFKLGVVWVAEALWERLEIGSTLRTLAHKQGVSPLVERALFAMTANCLEKPSSKLGVWERWLKRVHLPSCQGLTRDALYEAMDFLHSCAEEVEKTVFFHTAELLNLDVDLLFYDTTTCSFAIDDEDDDNEERVGLRRLGHAKEGPWAAQVVVALAVTREGLPVRSWVLPGTSADVTTVEKVKQDLRGWKLGRALFVGDAGMNSEDNRQILARGCGKYILAMRVGSVAEVKEEVLSRPGRYQKIAENLYAKEVVVGEGERRRRYVLCFNPREAERQAKHRAERVGILQVELARHPNDKATAKWAMELLTSLRYKQYLQITEDGRIRLDSQAIQEAKRLDGKGVLVTNDDTLSVHDAACAYQSMMVIEQCFRSLKRTQIQLGPMFHRLPERIEAHVKICVLALLLQRFAERITNQPWGRLREVLNTLQVSEFKTPSHQFFQRNELGQALRGLLKTLDISAPKRILGIHPLPSNP
jgi:Transposase